MASPQLFEFEKGHVFISGLFWQPLPGVAPAARKAEIEKIASEQNFNLIVTRTMGALQVGFGSVESGARKGMLSAAAMISKTTELEGIGRNFLCATDVGGGKWLYVAQREGVILHDGDIIGVEDEIRTRMLTDLSLSDWETVFAPDHWSINDSTERSFRDFLPQKKSGRFDYKKWWALKPVKKSLGDFKGYWPYALALIVCFGAFYGYSRWKSAQEMAAYSAQKIAQENANANQAQKIEHPWKLSAPALKFAAVCNDQLLKVKTLWPANWIFNDATCAGGNLTISWTRSPYGLIEQLQEIEPNAVFSSDGAFAGLVMPLVFPVGADDALPAEKIRTLAMNNVAQKYGFKLSIAAPQEAASLPGDKPVNQLNVKPWKELTWGIQGTSLSPVIILGAMDGMGFRVNGIKTVIVEGVMNWNMEGIQYVQQ